jgi:hypothetical protein
MVKAWPDGICDSTGGRWYDASFWPAVEPVVDVMIKEEGLGKRRR